MSLSASRCNNLPLPHSLVCTGCQSQLPQLPSAADKARVKQRESRQATLYVSFNSFSAQHQPFFFLSSGKSGVEVMSGARR